jgi:uncharacterized protein DUF4412
MKRLISICLGIVFVATISRADVVVELKIPLGTQMTNETLIKIKDNKIREDFFGNESIQISRITDLTTSNVFELSPKENKVKHGFYIARYPPPDEWPQFQDTGKIETIDGYEAEIYVGTNEDESVTLWVAKDFPNFEKLKTDLIKLDQIESQLPEFGSLSGMPLKWQRSVHGHDFPPFAISAKEESLQSSDFEIPADYHGLEPDGDFFRSMRGPPNYSVNLDLNDPTNFTGVPPARHDWFPMGSYEFCVFEGTVTTQIKMPDGKIISEDFHMVVIERDHNGILNIQLDSLGWQKPEKAISHFQRELRDWASDVLSPDQRNEKEAELRQWMTTDNNEQFKGFFVKRPGYTLNFTLEHTLDPQNLGFPYRYQIQLREPTRDWHQFPIGISKPQPKQ